MTYIEQLRADMEAAAAQLGVKPSTLGERAGQGGQFYKRLVEGKKVWPQTADKVREAISSLLLEQSENTCGCEVSHKACGDELQGRRSL